MGGRGTPGPSPTWRKSSTPTRRRAKGPSWGRCSPALRGPRVGLFPRPTTPPAGRSRSASSGYTSDRHALNGHHLHRHKQDAERFLSDLSDLAGQGSPPPQAQAHVILDQDGVPWNNNVAENAIKRF